MIRRLLARAYSLSSGLSEQWAARMRQWLLAEQATLDPSCRVYPTARIECLGGDRSSIRVGAQTHLRGQLLTAAHGGRISIGDWCYIGEGTRIWSAAQVTIGDRVLVSHDCEIHDWNAHSLDAAERHQHFREIVEHGHPRQGHTTDASQIIIHDDVWIGFGSAIMKGVTIGARSVVASRSLVLSDIPDDTLVAGSPARAVRTLERQ